MTRVGVLCLHGLGGSPHSVQPITQALRQAGYLVAAPLLAGHGTRPSDLADCTWIDWLSGANEVAQDLANDCDAIVIVGQSLGASLAIVMAARRDDVVGLAVINPLVVPADPDTTEHLEYLLSRGRTMQPAGEPDVRDPTAHDETYNELPLQSLLELDKAAGAAAAAARLVRGSVLVVSSDYDNVVDPTNSDVLATKLTSGAATGVTRLRLANSGHVAALDLDRDLLCRELLTWLANLTDSSASAG